MAGGGATGVAVGSVAVGGVLVWSGLRGASLLRTVQEIVQGKKPAGVNAFPIDAPAAGDAGTPGGAAGQAGAMVATARSQIGVREGAGNSQKYSRELGRPAEAWCADFIDWCAKQTGNSGVIPQTASAPGMAQAFGARFRRGSAGIQPGDIVFYSGAANGWNGIGHAGIAITANIGGTWQSVEGNYGDHVALNTRHTCQGYAHPAYTGTDVITGVGHG